MIPAVVSSFRSQHEPPPPRSGLHRATRVCCLARHTALLLLASTLPPISLARRIQAAEFSLDYSGFSSASLLSTGFHAPTCMRAHARLQERRIDVREYVRMSLSHSIFQCARSLDPCTVASPAPGSRVGAAGTPRTCLSLSGNVPTEQPTLALTLCPFRGGVVARAVSLSLTLSAFLSPSHTQTLPLFLALLSARRISFRFLLRDSIQSLFLSPPPFVSPTLRRLVLRSMARVSLSS